MNRSNTFVLSSVLFAVTSTASLDAQKYRAETNRELAIAYLMHEKLGQVPEQIGSETSHLVQRFEPLDRNDFISGKLGTYEWYAEVLRFNKTGRGGGDGVDGPTTGGGEEDEPKTPEEAFERLRREKLAESEANSFEEWVNDPEKDRSTQNREFVMAGKSRSGSKTRPDSTLWEYYDVDHQTYAGQPVELVWYCCAAVYDLEDKEVAIVVRVPIPKSGRRLPSKYKKIAYTIITSVELVEDFGEDESDEEKDQYADTPEKQRMLDVLKDNLKDVRNKWDYFTLPHYIVTFSWEEENNRQDYIGAKNFAQRFAKEMEHVRDRFAEFYPEHETMTQNYSIIRICSNYDEFSKYGNTPRGVVGWFSPGTKELVVFYDRDKLFGRDPFETTLGVVFHEAWHQYSDQWWPESELHRWFDEGLAEFFNGQRRIRGDRWKFFPLEGRLRSVKRQMDTHNLIPTGEIIYWSRAKFYGPRAADHYAQAYVMVDYLMRGKERLGRRFPESLEKVIETYGAECLSGTDPKEAVDKAFEGVDIDEFDTGWKAWYTDGHIER